MLIEREDLLNEWIKKRIESLSDAEPTAFAKYVQALLRKDADEDKLKNICADQLEVFLGSKTTEFVESLFETLKNKVYVNTSAESTSEARKEAKPAPSKAGNGDAKPVRRRISPPPRDDKDKVENKEVPKDAKDRDRRRRSRSPDRRRRQHDDRRRRSSRSRSPHRREHREDRYRRERTTADKTAKDSTAPATGRPRRRCRDFEEQGLCRRGESCPFDHGPDPIVLPDGSIDQYQPAEVAAAASSQPAAPEYNPEQPQLNSGKVFMGPPADFSVPPPALPEGAALPLGAPIPSPYDHLAAQRFAFMRNQLGSMRRGAFVGGRGKRRYNPYSNERQPINKSTTLELRKVPVDLNKLGPINDHFSQFGTITNIQMCWNGEPDTAIVTFAKLSEAQAAIKSEKPIMDNRFIQVSWHKPAPPVQPQAPAAPNASAPGQNAEPVIPFSADAQRHSRWPPNQLPQAEAAQQAKQKAYEEMMQRRKQREHQSKLQELLRLKSSLYEKLLSELKNVYTKVMTVKEEKTKEELLKIATTLEGQIKQYKAEIAEAREQLQEIAEKMKKPRKEEEEDPEAVSPNDQENRPDNSQDAESKSVVGAEEEEPSAAKKVKKELDEEAVHRLLDESDDEPDEPADQRVRVEDLDEDELLA